MDESQNNYAERHEYAYCIIVFMSNFGKRKIIHSGRNQIIFCLWGWGELWEGRGKGLQRDKGNFWAYGCVILIVVTVSKRYTAVKIYQIVHFNMCFLNVNYSLVKL